MRTPDDSNCAARCLTPSNQLSNRCPPYSMLEISTGSNSAGDGSTTLPLLVGGRGCSWVATDTLGNGCNIAETVCCGGPCSQVNARPNVSPDSRKAGQIGRASHQRQPLTDGTSLGSGPRAACMASDTSPKKSPMISAGM